MYDEILLESIIYIKKRQSELEGRNKKGIKNASCGDKILFNQRSKG